MEVYKVCLPPKLRAGELTFANISVTFGTPSPSDFRQNVTWEVLIHFVSRTSLHRGIIDLLAFSIIFATARGSPTSRIRGIPSILDAILRDATIYFLLIVASQSVLFFSCFLPRWVTHITSEVGLSCCTHRPCVFRRNFGSYLGCKFSLPLNQK